MRADGLLRQPGVVFDPVWTKGATPEELGGANMVKRADVRRQSPRGATRRSSPLTNRDMRPISRSKSLPQGSRSIFVAASSFVLSVLLLAAAVIAGIVIFTIIRSSNGSDYQATIEEVLPHGLSQVTVTIRVSNLGTAATEPTCQIELNSPGHSVTGVGSFTANRPIAGGNPATYSLTIPVTAIGATDVTTGASSITCH